jgi:hypothetical protein
MRRGILPGFCFLFYLWKTKQMNMKKLFLISVFILILSLQNSFSQPGNLQNDSSTFGIGYRGILDLIYPPDLIFNPYIFLNEKHHQFFAGFTYLNYYKNNFVHEYNITAGYKKYMFNGSKHFRLYIPCEIVIFYAEASESLPADYVHGIKISSGVGVQYSVGRFIFGLDNAIGWGYGESANPYSYYNASFLSESGGFGVLTSSFFLEYRFR